MQFEYKFYEQDATFTMADLVPLLHEGKVLIEFKKNNGELRRMLCTLKEEYLPEQKPKKETVANNENQVIDVPANLAVWDLENDGWRSFRLDRVVQFQTA